MPAKIAIALFVSLWLGPVGNAAPAQPTLKFSSPQQQLALVELFTSEGCSSCPPADRWFSSLQGEAQLWKDFVPVAFHVDYWDYIGWKDRFASPEFSQRQRRYSQQGGVGTVYTPGMLQNGREWRGWYRGEGFDRTVRRAGVLGIEVAGDEVVVEYQSEGKPNAALTVHVALLGMDLESQVSAGENKGRRLQHDFVVLGIESRPLPSHGNQYAATLPLPGSTQPAPRYAIAAWVSPSGREAPVQAVGGYLDYPPGD